MSETNIKIYRNDELIHDCTLCKNPEGRVGWYDAVDGTFHDRADEPASREPLFVQYIDTGFYPLNKQGATHIDAGNKWISVKRQRPRYKEKVLFADLVGVVHFATDSLDWDDGHVVFYVPALGKWLRGDMWMPLPAPPKEEA